MLLSRFSTNLCVETVSTFGNILRASIRIKMLAPSVRHDVAIIVSLQTTHEEARQLPAHVRVLTVRLLVAAPARVSYDVDDRTPAAGARVLAVVVVCTVVVVLCSDLQTGCTRNVEDDFSTKNS